MKITIDNFENVIFTESDLTVELDSSLTTDAAVTAVIAVLNREKAEDYKEDYRICMSQLSTDAKVGVLRYCMSDSSIMNSTLLMNVINLIKAYNQLQSSFFSDEYVVFNSLVEFLDIKTALAPDIDVYVTELAKWYLSLFQSVHKVEKLFLDARQEMPNSYLKIITTFDFFTLSGIVSNAKPFDTSALMTVDNALGIVNLLANKQCATDFMLKNLFSESAQGSN